MHEGMNCDVTRREASQFLVSCIVKYDFFLLLLICVLLPFLSEFPAIEINVLYLSSTHFALQHEELPIITMCKDIKG